MDPTAPKDNQAAEEENNNKNNPIQPGQFVVSGENADPQQNPQPPVQSQNQPLSSPQMPSSSPATDQQSQAPKPPDPPVPTPDDLKANLQESVAQATGQNLAGISQPPQNITQDPSTTETNMPYSGQQPDPTPFSPPDPQAQMQPPPSPIPSNDPSQLESSQPPMSPVQNQASDEGGSKGGKFKMLVLFLSIIILVAIIAAVAWFFILNQNASKPESTNGQINTIEGPPIPSPSTEESFGTIVEPTPEATESSDEILEENPTSGTTIP